MRLKSFVVAIIALFVIANVIVAGVRRSGIIPDGASDPGETVQRLQGAASPADGTVSEPERAGVAPAKPPAGVEGLQLLLSRPLMFDLGALGGLAADDEFLYVAAWEDGSSAAILYQVHPDSYSVAQVRALSETGVTAVGGIDEAGGRVWVPLARGDEAPATVVLAVDAATLEVRERFEAAAGFVAVAASDEGRVYGVSDDGALWVEWLPDGTLVRRVAGIGGVRYSDLAYVRGSLVAAGSDGATGVIDVIEPGGFTLLARHVSAASAADGAWVTGGGLEVREDTVLLLPEGGARPPLLTYVPAGGDLGQFVPSLAGVAR